MKIKRCSDCRRFLSENSFPWRNKKKGYSMSYCRKCQSNRTYLWRLDNPEYFKQWRENNPEYQRQWHKDNPECKKQYNNHRRKNNPECDKQYRKNNPDKVNAKNARRRARKLKQTPDNANQELINKFYKLALILSKNFWQSYEVDHIIPLDKDGLHHEDNLQIITKAQNLEKLNKLDTNIKGITLDDINNHSEIFNTIGEKFE